MIGRALSHYQIVEQLGEGNMGVVYKARDLQLDRYVALKVLHRRLASSTEFVARFEREAKAISALNHPNIATIYGVSQAEGLRFLILEYLPGGTLRSKLQALGVGERLPYAEVVDCALQVAEGLAHAHRRGVVHRDRWSADDGPSRANRRSQCWRRFFTTIRRGSANWRPGFRLR